jgi:hypothetical protein
MHTILKSWQKYKAIYIPILLYLLVKCLPLLDHNKDGIIRDISVKYLTKYVVFCICLVTAIILGAKSSRSYVKNVTFSVFTFILLWLFLEFISWGINKTELFNFKKPNNTLLLVNVNADEAPHRPFWGDFNEVFGKWRLPNDSLQKIRCEDNKVLEYQTNSVGARDKERSLKNLTGKTRIAVMGDSFIEGVMVNTPERCSDILEVSTGKQHLNFGINGTSPINYYLIYRELAKKYEHNAVIIGILPANDFQDFSDGDDLGLINFPIYRPYWKSTNLGYELKYSLASINQAYGSKMIYDKPHKIHATKDSVYKNLPLTKKLQSELNRNSYAVGLVSGIMEKKASEKFSKSSIFEEYPQDKWGTFSYSLEQLFEEAKGKKILVLTIPILKDIQLYQKNHKNTLAPKMASFLKNKGVEYIDLLPILAREKNPEQFYHPCDGHWNEKGEKKVADILINNTLYQRLIQ